MSAEGELIRGRGYCDGLSLTSLTSQVILGHGYLFHL